MSGDPILPKRPYTWARQHILDSFAAERAIEWRRSLDEHEELAFRVEGRDCLLALWSGSATLEVSTTQPILPPSLRLNEATVWGHQREEEIWTGAAVRAGDPAFDRAYVILGAGPNVRPSEEEARSLAPELKSLLLKRRSELEDATLEPERLKLWVASSGRAGPPPSLEGARDRVLWTLGVAFLGFRYIPSARDLEAGLDRAVALAEALEAIRTGSAAAAPAPATESRN
jgi:hypothetical protein